jgi:hypothetical protein
MAPLELMVLIGMVCVSVETPRVHVAVPAMSTISFGTVSESTTLNFKLKNPGTADVVTISDVTFGGSDPAHFMENGTVAGTITITGEDAFEIEFDPTDGSRFYSAQIEISHDATGTASPLIVLLEGTKT